MSNERSHETARLIARQARERFVAATEGMIAPTAQAIRERLDALATQTGSVRDMYAHRDDLVAFAEQQSRWVDLARTAWRKALGNATIGNKTNSASAGLELIGDEVVENNILSSRLALVIQDKASFELNDLRLRIQHLEGINELSTNDVLRPEVLAKSLVEQWLAAGLSRAMWTKVQDVVHAQILDVIQQAYKNTNQFLISQGVMPEIDLKGLVRRAHGAPSSAPMGVGPAIAARPAGAAEPMMPGGFAPAAIGVRAGAAATPNGARWAGAGGAGMANGEAADGGLVIGGSPFMVARQRAQGVLSGLKRFVSARLGNDFVGGSAAQSMLAGGSAGGAMAPGAASPVFVQAIMDAEVAYRAAASHYVVGDEATAIQQGMADMRRRTAELKKKAPTTADKATVEIVALMFQAILAEERIPFSARVWFARLQMPVLRVAIAEPEFFGTLQHPARMLIDRMGSCVMGFDAAAISGSALENEIRRVVQVIEQYPETGQRVFKLVYDEFVAFLSKYLTQSDATQRLMSVAQQVEQKETMAIQYTIELRKMLNDMPVRDEIREFLFKIWAEVLAMAALRYGPQDQQTVTLKRAAADLVWAASAKPSRTDRARVIQDLPNLLQRLRQGMSLMGIEGEPQEQQIRTIGETLSDAFMSKTDAIPSAQIDAMSKRLANLEDFFSDEGATELPLDAASIELLLGVDATSIEVVPDTGTKVSEEMLAWAHELQVGNWFMLDHNNRVTQVQFVWRSDRKQLHLFASPGGNSFLIQAGRLASYLQAGLLVPAEEETLTVRATREALAKLDANPERLLD
ncbi:DUF1631 family protein [Variovorax dokdonensis]|uniref:DUF1631 family protein n=1 Tax=Variovorax dokdonensis TaxID=344883 RepID=A0ABT7N9S4_9BURK|nr:DUF1631 family protein [Variovorax dokdonensis]MDM0044682.1 DUF1631 family protein [Variovorax dokdonensis]